MNILLTSAGRRTYLVDYFMDAMKGIGKVYASNSIYTYTLSHANDFVLTPLIYDSNYIPFLLDYCKQKGISAIIPLFDIDLSILAEHKGLFAQNGINVIVADKNAIEICNDKWNTYIFLRQNQLDCPKTYQNLLDVKTALNGDEINFPICIKPRWGMGSIGIQIAENEEELQVLSNIVYRQIVNTYLKYESSQDLSNCIVYQEKIDAQEFGLDIFNDLNGHLASVVAKKKVSMRSGETDIAETVDNAVFLSIASKLSTKLHHIGNLDVDLFKTDDNHIIVLELNCRFGGQYPFSHLAGVNFPKQIVKWLLGDKTDESLIRAIPGVKSCKDLTPVEISVPTHFK